ncbi:MAG: pilus assembly protein TadG-related protein [Candidatus Omnitrophica bacterium]|nr:pilus assembly protein TadG-related protein [Candidatus Omnitrophota bacterium]
MLNSFYKKFSLGNLKDDKPQGQISTLLILMIVVILIMILTTVNLGQLSLSSTNLSNVADSASLSLASQLATRSYGLYKSLGNTTCKCQSGAGGFGGIIGAIVGAVLAVVAVAMCWNPVGWSAAGLLAAFTAIGAAGGLVGGAVGAAATGGNIATGAITGFMIGAAIGAAYGSFGTAVAAEDGAIVLEGAELTEVAEGTLVAEGGETIVAGSEGGVVAVNGGAEVVGGSEITMAANSQLTLEAGTSYTAAGVTIVPANVPITTVAAGTAIPTGSTVIAGGVAIAPSLSAAAAMTLSASSNLYNAYVAEQNQAAAFSAAVRMLNGLPDYDHFRESILLQVFSQTVDDPNKDIDFDDLSGDGKIDDKVSHFLYYWNGRMKYLKSVIPTLQSITSSFFNGTLKDSEDYIQTEIQGPLSKLGDTKDITQDGSIARIARALNPDFWNPKNDGSFDAIVSGFKSFIADSEAIEKIDINQLTAQWQTYIKIFYNQDTGKKTEDGNTITDYYYTLGEVKGYLSDWKTEIIAKRNQLPSCKVGTFGSIGDESPTCQPCNSTYCANDCIVSSGPEISPLPCKLNFTLQGGSLDYNIDDEVTPALNDIDSLISKISGFQDAIKQYVKDMENAYSALESGYGGLNPATYSWTDSRGDHSIKVGVGPYQLARTIKTESGGRWSKTICIRMVDYTDDGNCWVQITKQEPKDKELKSGRVSLGMWNPFFSGIITKKSKAYYSYDTVGLTQ